MTSYIATMAETLPLDPTLDEIRAALIADVAANAAFDGWGEAAVRMAAEAEGIDVDLARLAFTGGAVEMIDTWFAHIDAEMASRLPPEQLGAMKIRERVAASGARHSRYAAEPATRREARLACRRCHVAACRGHGDRFQPL